MKNDYAAWAARWRVPLGFAFAIAYLVLCQPAPSLIIAGGLVALAGLCLRAAAAGHLEKSQCLATTGPFRYTRNPLYLGSFVLGLGFMVSGARWILGVAFIVLFTLIYAPVLRREEASLRQKFGAAYEAYARQVPLFFPLPNHKSSGKGRFKWVRYRRNHEYEAACGYIALMIFLAVKWLLR